ncbi:MAG: hypothetical protein QM811_29755 [Pirellulales bacterium]
MSVPTAEIVVRPPNSEESMRWNLTADGLRWQAWGMTALTVGSLILVTIMSLRVNSSPNASLWVQLSAIVCGLLTAIGVFSLLPGHVLAAFAPRRPLLVTLSLAAMFALGYALLETARVVQLTFDRRHYGGYNSGPNDVESLLLRAALGGVLASMSYGVLSIGNLIAVGAALAERKFVRRGSLLLFFMVLSPLLQALVAVAVDLSAPLGKPNSPLITAGVMLLLNTALLVFYLYTIVPLIGAVRIAYPLGDAASQPPAAGAPPKPPVPEKLSNPFVD